MDIDAHDGRLDDERPRHVLVRPVLVVIARHDVHLAAIDLSAQRRRLDRGHLIREITEDVQVVGGRHTLVDRVDERAIHMRDIAKRAIGEMQHVGMAEVRVRCKPDHETDLPSRGVT